MPESSDGRYLPPAADRLRHRDLSAGAQRRFADRGANGAVPARTGPQRRADPSAPARRGSPRRRRRAAHRRLRDSGVPRAALRAVAGRPAAAPLRAHAARAGPPRHPRAAGLGGARRGAGAGDPDDLRLPHQLPPVQPLLRAGRFRDAGARPAAPLPQPHRAHLRADASDGARARRRRLPQPDDGRARRRHRALRAGAPQRRPAPRVAGRIGAGAADGRPRRGGEERRARPARVRAGPTEPARDCAWSSSATARRDRACNRRIPRLASSASGAAPTWPRTTPRPTCSCSRACPTPSATSSWRRSLPACRWCRSRSPRRQSTSPTGWPAGSSRPATRRPSSPRSSRSTAPGSSLESMRDAALAAARRATWPEVLARFEARLEDTVHALETPQSRVPVVA